MMMMHITTISGGLGIRASDWNVIQSDNPCLTATFPSSIDDDRSDMHFDAITTLLITSQNEVQICMHNESII